MEKIELNQTINATDVVVKLEEEPVQESLKNHAIVGDILENSNNSTTNSQMQTPSEKSENNDAPSSPRQNAKDMNKRERRLMQNRQSASRLRLKKKETMSQLLVARETLKQENTTLQNNVEESQKELFNAMEQSISLRKRIDEIQCKNNELLLSFFNDIQNGSIQAPSQQFQQQVSTMPHAFAKFGEPHQTPAQAPQNYLLNSQGYDLQTALSILMGANPVGQTQLPALSNLNLQSQSLNFENSSLLNRGADETLRHKTQGPESFGKLLNGLGQDYLKEGEQISAFQVPN